MSSELEQEVKTVVFNLVIELSDLATVAHKGGNTLLVVPDAINNHVAAIAALIRQHDTDMRERLLEAVKGGSVMSENELRQTISQIYGGERGE